MREVEVKSVVDDPAECRHRVEAAGGRLVFEGRLEDRRYDRPGGELRSRDEVLRLRVYTDPKGKVEAYIDRKGPTSYDNGYKVREETSAPVNDPVRAAAELEADGYVVTREITRRIAQYELLGAMVRIEEYPRMDTLIEIEGEPEAIEEAISATGLPRFGFTSDRLPDFVRRFELRTGVRAAICDAELLGIYNYLADDA